MPEFLPDSDVNTFHNFQHSWKHILTFHLSDLYHCWGYFDTARKNNHSSFLTPTVVAWRCPLPSEICAQIDDTPVEKRQLWQISTYNVSTVRDSEKSSNMTNRKSTTGFPTSYRWSAYVTFKSPKEWLKSDFLFFFNKIRFQSNKVRYRVSLCENIQRQSCSITIPLSNGP